MRMVRACGLLAILYLLQAGTIAGASANVAFAKTHATIVTLGAGLVRVRVVHIANEIETFAAISPHELLTFPRARRVVIRDASTIARIADLIRKSLPMYRGKPGGFDARWSLAFEKRDGSIVRVFFDRFGSDGAIDGMPVRFVRAPLADRLSALLPMLERRERR